MSTVADHLADPILDHRDPNSPGKIAMWLFLASEIMFFVGLLGTYIILRAGQPKLFSDHQEVLSKPLAAVNTVVLIASSLIMAAAVEAARRQNRKKTVVCLLLTLLFAATFLCIKGIEYNDKYHHYTVVATEGTGSDRTLWAYDGHIQYKDEDGRPVPDNMMALHGYRVQVTGNEFNINVISQHEMKLATGHGDAAPTFYEIPKASISESMWYGPWKNNFFASYYVLTGVHVAHIVCGMIAVFILLCQAGRGKVLAPAIEYTGLYWHFVDLVWIFLFALLYLI